MTDRPVIVYRLGSLGDTIVSLPAFHQVARSFPNSRRVLVTNDPVSDKAPSMESILRPAGLIDDVITYTVGERSRSALLRLLLKIRATGANTLVYLAAGRGQEAIRRDLRFFRWCGLRKVIGAPLTDDLHDHRSGTLVGHFEAEAERLARTLAPLGAIDLDDPANWDLRLTIREREVAETALAPLGGAPFFAFNLGGKAANNDWGAERWKALLASLNAEFATMAIVAIGAPGDHARSQRAMSVWSGRRVNLCGTLAPRESAAVLTRARLFVGHDSGPMHLAAASGTATIGLFGNNNPPGIWHPYGAANRALRDERGMDAIEVDTVLEAVRTVARGKS